MERVHPDDLAKVRAAIDSAMPGTDTYGYEARIRHADGTYRWMSIRGKVVQRDNRGAATRMLGVRMDINEQTTLTSSRTSTIRLAAALAMSC